MRLRTLTLGLLTLVAAQGLAQNFKFDEFDFHVANLGLLQNKQVQKGLGVTASQRTKMNQAAQRYEQDIKKLADSYRAQKKDPRLVEQDPKFVGHMIAFKKNVLAQLSASQIRRLREITLQTIGMAAVLDPVVAKKIGMSAADSKKFQAVYRAGAEKYSAAERKALAPIQAKYKDKKPKTKAEEEQLRKQLDGELQAMAKKVQPQLKAILKESSNKLRAALSKSQRVKLEQLKGKPFKP